jgi:3-deoxy-7-phosphoheptulonate synthase
VQNTTDDLRIREISELVTPAQVIQEFPRTEAVTATVSNTRGAIHRMLRASDDRLIIVIGPCSIHDPVAARDYAERLAAIRARVAGELEIVMRV